MDLSFYRILKWFVLSLIVLLPFTQAIAGTVLVANTLSNTVTLFDDTTLKPIRELSVGYMPHEVAVTPNGKLALVTNFGDLISVIAGSTVSVIDIEHAKIIKTIQLAKRSRPHGIKFLSDTQALITVQGIQSLLLLDVETGKVTKTLKLPGSGAHMVTVDESQRYAYVSNTGSGTVCKVDLKSWIVINQTKVGKQSEGIALTKDENFVLATDSKDNYLAVLRTKDLKIVKKIRTGYGPVRVVIADNGNSAAVINSISGTVQVIDIASLTTGKTFKSSNACALLFAPANILVRDDQTTAYITNHLVNHVSLVDLKFGVVLKTFKSGYLPNGIAQSTITAVKTDNDLSFIYEFRVGPLEINANQDQVWKVSKDVENYARLSKGAITAHVDGEIAVGKTIMLTLYKDQCVGKFIPPSNELITTVDEEKKILGWQRELPLGVGHTERYQILEKISDNKTRSTIVLRIPGFIGSVTDLTLKKLIEDAFTKLNEGIKLEAERLRQ